MQHYSIFRQIDDGYGNALFFKFGRPYKNFTDAVVRLKKLEGGEIRDGRNIVLAVKCGGKFVTLPSLDAI